MVKQEKVTYLAYTPLRRRKNLERVDYYNGNYPNGWGGVSYRFNRNVSKPSLDVGYVRSSGIDVLRKILFGKHLICRYRSIKMPFDNDKSLTNYSEHRNMGFVVNGVFIFADDIDKHLKVVYDSIDEIDLGEIENRLGDFNLEKPKIKRTKKSCKEVLRERSIMTLQGGLGFEKIALKDFKEAEKKVQRAVGPKYDSFYQKIYYDDSILDTPHGYNILTIARFKESLPDLFDIAMATNIIKKPSLDELIKALN